MSDHIICPDCGKKISLNKCPTKIKLFFGYKTCTDCGCNFTAVSDNDKTDLHIVVYFVILGILGGGNLLLYVLNEKASFILFAVMFLAAISGIAVNLNRQKKFINSLTNSSNAFFPITENKKQDKIIKYVYENELSESEKNLKYKAIKKNNINVLLPYPDLYMLFGENSIDKLELYHTYKIVFKGSEIFVILSDIKPNGENILLYFKSFGKGTAIESENEYKLLTLSDEVIGCVKLTGQTAP